MGKTTIRHEQLHLINAELLREQARLEDEVSRKKTSFSEEREGAENRDRAQIYERYNAIMEGLNERLREVRVALKKIEDGTYGNCDLCGEGITADRLISLHTAILCTSCKENVSNNNHVRHNFHRVTVAT